MDFTQMAPVVPSELLAIHDPVPLYTAEQVQAAVEAAIATLPETP